MRDTLELIMPTLEQAIKNLNTQQQLAVETIEGPVMVIAGPGTGKTQVLALRIANILQKTDARPENILCLTFTEAGVKAMRERLARFIGKDAYYVAIHTFHSFANDIIQTFPEKFSFSKNLQQLDDLTRIKIIRSVLDSLELKKYKPFHDPYQFQGLILQGIQTLKKEGINPEEFGKRIQRMIEVHEDENKNPDKPTKKWLDQKEKIENQFEVQQIYAAYQKALSDEGFYDYEDMILFVIEQMQEDDSLLAYLQEQYLYIHVDEYQDTNGAQNEIVRLLGSFDPSPNIFVVGDDDQAIYRFQGANLDNILFFGKHFENVIKIPTPLNYRSSQLILDLADSLITNNNQRLVNEYTDLDKKLKKGVSEIPEQVAEVWECENGDVEVIQLAEEIKKLHEQGVNYKDIAILYRKNKHGDDIAKAFAKLEIPTQLKSSESIFETIAIQQLLLLLKTIYSFNKTVDVDIYHLLQCEFTKLPLVEVWKANMAARSERKGLFEFLLNQLSAVGYQLSDKDPNPKHQIPKLKTHNSQQLTLEASSQQPAARSLANFMRNLLQWHKDSYNLHITELFEKVINESGLIDYFNTNDDIFYNVLAINALYEYVKQQETLNAETRLEDLLRDLELIQEQHLQISVPTIQRNDDSVQLLTVHSSKGLEFEYVFITRMTENNWEKQRAQSKAVLPTIYSENFSKDNEKAATVEDERRLLFVAITRAKQKVYLTYAKEYSQDNNTTSTQSSLFLHELNYKLIEKKSFAIETESADAIVRKLRYVEPTVYSEDEYAYLKERVQNFKLSATALNTYLDSPQEFKERYLLRIPQVKEKELVLGTSIHAALERYNRTLQSETRFIASSDGKMSLDEMLAVFTERLKKEFYGFDDYDKTVEEGISILTNYYSSVLQTDGRMPVEVEYSFSRNHVWLDIPDQDPILLEGRIDEIQYIDKDYGEVKVIDYKTSKPKTRNDILGQTKASNGDIWRQLVFYKILGDCDEYFRPERSLKNPKYKIKEACVEFLRPQKDSYKEESFEITDEDVRELKEVIYDVVKKIRNLEFPE